MPNFLLIGAGKSGTTSIYHALKQHPDIYMSSIKEPNFFALEGCRKTTGYDAGDPHGFNFYPWAVTDLKSYSELFSEASEYKRRGEASTMYQYSKRAAHSIKAHIPEVKLIAIFRQPAERLYSRYLHLARENRQPTESFEDCLTEGNIWWQKDDLIQEGFYFKHMRQYFKLFSKNQIKIFLYEDLKKNRVEMMSELFSFLEIEKDIPLDMTMEYNPSGYIKNPFLDRLIGQKSLMKSYLNKFSPRILEGLKKSKVAQKWLLHFRKKNLNRPALTNDLKQQLTSQVYYEDVLKFQDLIGRDLSSWLRI